MTQRWIDSYLSSAKGKILAKIDEEFIENTFNITGLKPKIKYFTPAYELIKRNTTVSAHGKIDQKRIEADSELLYGLIHARFLLTKNGMQQMYEKYQKKLFQECPRVYCKDVQCIPYGISEEIGVEKIKMFCPSCQDIYEVEDNDIKDLDGSCYGPSWVHMFLQKYPSIIPKEPPKVYVPKIYGYLVCHYSDKIEESDDNNQK